MSKSTGESPVAPIDHEENDEQDQPDLVGVAMRAVYRLLAIVVTAGVLVQLVFMAFGAFTVAADAEDGVTIDGAYSNTGQSLHRIGGTTIGVVVLVLLIVSFFAKVQRGIRLAAALVGLTVLQIMLATVAFGVPALGALHGLNAMAIATVAEMAARAARKQAGGVSRDETVERATAPTGS